MQDEGIRVVGSAAARTAQDTAAMEAILHEQLARIEAMYGADGMARIRRAFVVVVGLGGGALWFRGVHTIS
jgi:tRNA A37 threonylcarbamoyladenosine dehydratase